MKKRNLLFTILSTLCVGLIAGCGETKYYIGMVPASNEWGLVQGSGTYKEGATVELKVYANEGCQANPTGAASVLFKKNGTESFVDSGYYLDYSSSGKYYFKQFAVSADTAGEYKVNFSCVGNTIDQINKDREVKYKVNYIMINNTTSKKLIYKGAESFTLKEGETYEIFAETPETEDTEAIPKNQQILSAGEKVVNVAYIDEKFDSKIEWYVGDLASSDPLVKYDFEKPLEGDLNLYGVFVPSTPADMVNEAINNFSKTESLKVTSSLNGVTESAEIVNYSQLNVASRSGFQMLVKSSDGTDKYVVQAPASQNGLAVYMWDNSRWLSNGMFSLGASGYTIDKIYDLYKFIEVGKYLAVNGSKIDEDKYEISWYSAADVTAGETENATWQDGDKRVKFDGDDTIYNVLKISDKITGEKVATVYISKGKLYKTNINDAQNTIEYLNKKPAMTAVRDPKTVKFLKLSRCGNHQNPSDPYYALFNELEARNEFSSVLKYISDYDGGNISAFIQKNMRNILKYYSYSVDTRTDPVCVSIQSSLRELETVVSKLKTGKFDIISTVDVEGFGIVARKYSVAEGKDILEDSFHESASGNVGNELTKLHPMVSRSILELKNILQEKPGDPEKFYEFVYDNGEYKFYDRYYEDKDTAVPLITVKVVGDRVAKLTYYDKTRHNTYVSSIEYGLENIINKISKGNLYLNGKFVTEGDYFTSNHPDADVAGFFANLKALKDNRNYNPNNDSYTNEKGVYKIIYDEANVDLIVEVQFTPVGTSTPISYKLAYIEELLKQIEELGKGGYNLDGMISVPTLASGTYFELGTKPEDVGDDAWLFISKLKNFLEDYASYTYVYSLGGNYYEDSLGNWYQFIVENGKIVQVKHCDGASTKDYKLLTNNLSDILSGIEELGKGGFNLDGKVVADGDYFTEIPEGTDVYVEDFFKMLDNFITFIESFMYDEENDSYYWEANGAGTYKFVIENGKLVKIEFTPYGGSLKEYNLTYDDTYKVLAGIELAGKGNFTLDGTEEVASTAGSYLDLDLTSKPEELTNKSWELFKVLQEFKNNYGANYIYDVDTGTYTNESVGIYKFVLENDKLIKVEFTPTGESVVEYNLAYNSIEE